MTSWVVPIRGEDLHHWEVAKQGMFWDMPKRRGVRPGDLLYFWRSGVGGFVGRALVGQPRDLVPGDPTPWGDGRDYRLRVPFISTEDCTAPRVTWTQVMQETRLPANPSIVPSTVDEAADAALADLFGTPVPQPRPDASWGRPDIDLEADERESVVATINRRRGQQMFRQGLLRAYGTRCAVTGTTDRAVLEAAHIAPYRGVHTNVIRNGVLLRSDIHTLFDLHLLTLVPSPGRLVVRVAPVLGDAVYRTLDGRRALTPRRVTERPDPDLLRSHNEACRWTSHSPAPDTVQA